MHQASSNSQNTYQSSHGRRRASDDAVANQELPADYVPVQPHRSAYNAAGSGFIGGVALENYRRGLKAAQSSTTGDGQTPPPQPEYRQRPTPIANLASLPAPPSQPYSQTVASLPSPAIKPSISAPISSRWSPSAQNAAPEPGPSATALPMEPHRAKKGLPFLKNPMSTLLARRKGQSSQQETLQQPLRVQTETLYDPSIKGTRVHDFGAPRNSSTTPRLDSTAKLSQVPANVQIYEPRDILNNSVPQTDSGSNQALSAEEPRTGLNNQNTSTTMPATQHIRYDALPIHEEDEATGHVRLGSSDSINTSKSSKIRRSRNVSLSTIPKHMKSTSSRFSFVVGPTGQEKIMEEKHRQREIEKQETGDDFRPDSRFDEFDDDFDYDAMMDDDGLEERIPGVNASEDEDDGFGLQDQYLDEPSYDEEGLSQATEQQDSHEQSMLSQFVFQQSNPTSLHPSPQVDDGLLPTPRDANGNIIGSALTKDTPTTQTFPPSVQADVIAEGDALVTKLSGLGIDNHGTPMADTSAAPAALQPHPPSQYRDDDMYYDDGVLGYEGEFAEDLAAEPEYDSVPFDESIFDLDDTDEYGRPLPGAFAKAQSLRREAHTAAANRESDLTSGVSAHSAISHSTAHTSISDRDTIAPTSLPQNNGQHQVVSALGDGKQTGTQDPMAVYQAALAAAAYEAAASGKFCRAGSPELPGAEDGHFETPTDDYNDDDFGYENMDDFELDDDAIIAEANATALANDSDGWYGQEFGFYSSPHRNATQKTSEMGGFFGPKGLPDLARSASGRLISREPNLTPITERSEYSNRNSIMSMGLPGFQAGTPTLQSPGLAQLAMLAEYGDEDMSLSALMRLRSKAWGGSQASLSSSKEGSPQSERGELPSSPWGISQPPSAGGMHASGHMRQNSNFSAESRDSDIGSSPSSSSMGVSHTMHNSNYMNLQAARQPGNPLRGNSAPAAYRPGESRLAQSSVPEDEVVESAPGSAMPGRNSNEWAWGQEGMMPSAGTIPTSKHGKGHRRHNSSADSISYIMEEEEGGETRWVMERRRISSNGQLEILEREVLDKGRI